MLGYVQLLRPLNCLMTAVAVFVGGLLVMGGAPEGLLTLGIAMLAAFLVAGEAMPSMITRMLRQTR